MVLWFYGFMVWYFSLFLFLSDAPCFIKMRFALFSSHKTPNWHTNRLSNFSHVHHLASFLRHRNSFEAAAGRAGDSGLGRRGECASWPEKRGNQGPQALSEGPSRRPSKDRRKQQWEKQKRRRPRPCFARSRTNKIPKQHCPNGVHLGAKSEKTRDIALDKCVTVLRDKGLWHREMIQQRVLCDRRSQCRNKC